MHWTQYFTLKFQDEICLEHNLFVGRFGQVKEKKLMKHIIKKQIWSDEKCLLYKTNRMFIKISYYLENENNNTKETRQWLKYWTLSIEHWLLNLSFCV